MVVQVVVVKEVPEVHLVSQVQPKLEVEVEVVQDQLLLGEQEDRELYGWFISAHNKMFIFTSSSQ
jgi:hypothetical protein